ncbi:CGNR zinc finger domain-containing protein [Actibacterium ureilyticum]|uniref:CGNR zinc finger domain-containing protein n=1 Tax=Actibacterium ureilyticum TaxID=1590614 RepID=UPI00159619C8|nr:CGNR zinc finger domain-containing protein [Actibacterium ureilyticum]
MRPPAMIIADDPALDFLNTIGAPHGEMIEWIETGDDLKAWLLQAGLVQPSEFDDFPQDAETDIAAAEARHLRDEFRAWLQTGTTGIFEHLNWVLQRESGFWVLEPTPPHRMTRRLRFTQPGQLLVPVAIAIADLIARQEADRVRECANPSCTMWFRDVSRNNRRRWCSMSVCGNRAKVAAHRARGKG